MSLFIKMSILKKKYCKILQKLAISYLEILRIKGESQKKNWSILRLILKAPPIWVSCISCLRFTNAYLKFQVGQWFQTVVLLWKKVSEFLDSELKLVMQEGWSCIKDSGDFIKKLKNIDHIPQDAIMVTADVLGLYPSIPHDADLEALRKVLESRE